MSVGERNRTVAKILLKVGRVPECVCERVREKDNRVWRSGRRAMKKKRIVDKLSKNSAR